MRQVGGNDAIILRIFMAVVARYLGKDDLRQVRGNDAIILRIFMAVVARYLRKDDLRQMRGNDTIHYSRIFMAVIPLPTPKGSSPVC